GGTTTDIALIQGGQVTVSEEGATVGDYKTAVTAADLLSIALGGDSHIALNRERVITIGPERVSPLAYLAWRYPVVGKQLQALRRRQWSQAPPDWLDYWFLLRDKEGSTPREKELIDYLRPEPRPLPDILRHLQLLHVGQLNVGELFRQEIIGKAGLTLTDLMHVEKKFEPWDSAASQAGLEVLAHNQFMESDDLCRQIWEQVNEMILHTIVTFLSDKQLDLPAGRRAGGRQQQRSDKVAPQDKEMGRWFFYNSIYRLHPHLETNIRLRLPLIGIGAPAGIVLHESGRLLQTELVLPEHFQVANAVGAIAGSVMVSEELLVYPHLDSAGVDVVGYYVQASDERLEYVELEKALVKAGDLAQERALGAAIRSGADNPRVTVQTLTDGLDTYRIKARAIGNPRLAR
ncbi:MAG: hypothetical protein JXA42_07070, partial [Anaerolineales bacterium]|nr:hypothetical protein [Anaerolineales bacterium]